MLRLEVWGIRSVKGVKLLFYFMVMHFYSFEFTLSVCV